jgi:hypothetical protein
MDGLNKTNCAFALDGTCALDHNACKQCKVDRETSEFHKTIICGLTWDELIKLQSGGSLMS